MKTGKSRKARNASIVISLIIVLVALFGGYTYYHYNNEIGVYERSLAESDAAFKLYSPQSFINSATHAEPYHAYDHREDALYFYEAPEGFTLISHSSAWDQDMLELLYHELMLNEHGDEMDFLYELVVYPQEEENMLATYNLGTKAVSLFIQFPAFPDDFTIDFPQDIGSINLYGGDTKTTIESMAGSLSHEYGHLYTFYYMFDVEENETIELDFGEPVSLAETNYAWLREAEKHDLITSRNPADDYVQERHRYLFEIAAEDYVQLMGSATTRQVVDFVDVRQVLNGAEHPENITGARNAFPQENMMLPLAGDVPGLEGYFYSFIDADPRVPSEEKQTITLNIQRNEVQHNLVSGLRTFVYYTITWNTPYQNTIYTLVSYDPQNYRGWGTPIKTVRPGQAASAIIGEYVVERGDQVVSLDDGNADGVKVFYVTALLPDGTIYISDKLEYQF